MIQNYRDARLILTFAKELLNIGWCQFSLATNFDGRPCLPEDKSACQWCAIGAMRKSSIQYHKEQKWALAFLMKAAHSMNYISPEKVNDFIGKAEVIKLYDKAIELLDAEIANCTGPVAEYK